MSSLTVKELLVRMNDIALSLVENPAPDFTSYRERIGQYNGLKEAVNILTAIENEDDIKPTF